MNKKSINPCTRCGMERIDARSWNEQIQTFSGSVIEIHTQTICPNRDCQLMVDQDLVKQKEKRDKIHKKVVSQKNPRNSKK